MTKAPENQPEAVPARAKRDGKALGRWLWVEPTVWTERMLTALEEGVKGGQWFSLIDKIHPERTLHAAFSQVAVNKGAAGVDHVTVKMFADDLETNLKKLSEELRCGHYRPQQIRRHYIPKAGSKELRPLGIPTFEDKVLQRAVVMVLEAIYEQDFKDCSYGFRPGRSAHQALQSLWKQTMVTAGGWVVEVDIRKFFDTIDHGHLRDLLKRRVRDGVLLRLIGKWLNAGVLEDGCITHPDAGSPQGGVVSPKLSNVFLHYVLDDWFDREVQPRLKGHSCLIRFADDFVMGFTCEEDARRVMDVLPKRLEKYGLTIHPEKKDAAGAVRAAVRPSQTLRALGEDPCRDFRPAGVHAPLGSLSQGLLGGEAQDVQEPPQSRIGDHCAMVPRESTPRTGGTARDTESEASRPLCVLRDHGQRGSAAGVPARCHRSLEEMAWPSPSRR